MSRLEITNQILQQILKSARERATTLKNWINEVIQLPPSIYKYDILRFEAQIVIDNAGAVVVTQPVAIRVPTGKSFIIRKMRAAIYLNERSAIGTADIERPEFYEQITFNIREGGTNSDMFTSNLSFADFHPTHNGSGEIEFDEGHYVTTPGSDLRCTVNAPAAMAFLAPLAGTRTLRCSVVFTGVNVVS